MQRLGIVEVDVARGCRSLLACNGMEWLRGWVVFLCDPCYRFDCWRGFVEPLCWVIVFGGSEVWPLWRSH